MDPVTEMARALRDATHFESAAQALIRAGKRVLGGMLADWGAQAQVRSGTVHLHPDSPRQIVFGRDPDAHPPSRNAWAAIQRYRRPLVLDALTGKLTVFLEDDPLVENAKGEETVQRVLSNRATHLHVSPLFGPSGVVGQLSFEVAYRSPLDFESVADDEFVDRLMVMAELTTARLVLLPRASLRNSLCDAHMPVAGRLTQSTLHLLDRYAQRALPIVLRGPVGSGRTHLARWVHRRSGRAGPFVIFESAAAGAQAERLQAALAEAVAGTLLVRRPDMLDARSQELLSATIDPDRADAPRIILHADRRWVDAVEQGDFGADLNARVQDVTVLLTPLRERPEEIAEWARHFLALEGGQVSFSEDALVVLRARIWSDNLRGLRAVVRQARDNAMEAARGPAIIEPHHLARVSYVSQGEPDHARQEATLRAGLEALAEVLLQAGDAADGLKIDGAAGLVLWRLSQLAGGRDRALRLMLGKPPSKGNASRTWKRKIEPAVALAEQLGMHALVKDLKRLLKA